ncbi:hypothetical protein PT974_07171 [Cladobotryum mycophilum]|uniref:Nephrocystin 3-like N-terminal domain-containing protein n=1 Tax=Cladobotryum mycophilum TaxID=491253 RepID=A0ABR0SNS3_9HYPO
MAAPEDEDYIYQSAFECERLFDTAVSKASHHAKMSSFLEEYQQRFAQWTAYLGVFAHRTQSLDCRLQKLPDLKDLFMRYLDMLRRTLSSCNDRTHDDIHSEEISENTLPNLEFFRNDIQTCEEIEHILERLNRLGVLVRQSSRGYIGDQVKRFSSGLDTRYSEDLFSGIIQTLYPNAHQALRNRLVWSMTDTLATILYKRSRQATLSTRREVRNEPMSTILEESQVQETAPAVGVQRQGAPVKTMHTSLRPKSFIPPQSYRSSIDSLKFQENMKGFHEQATKSQKTFSAIIKQGNYPKPPEGVVYDTSIATSGHIFVLRRKHMQQHSKQWNRDLHLMPSWACVICEDQNDIFTKSDDLLQHLREKHDSQFTPKQLQAMSRQSRSFLPRPADECPICGFLVQVEGDPNQSIPSKRRADSSQVGSNKSSRTSLKQESASQSRSEDASHAEPEVEITTHDNVLIQSSTSVAKKVAEHTAAHLQFLMLLTERLLRLQIEDQSVDYGSCSEVDTNVPHDGDASTLHSQGLGESVQTDEFERGDIYPPDDPISDNNANHEDQHMLDAIETKNEPVDWSYITHNDDEGLIQEDPILQTLLHSQAAKSHARLLESLRFEQPESRYPSIKAAYSGTCEWLLTHPRYLDWLDHEKATHHHGILWVKGKPGSGKSTLMRFTHTHYEGIATADTVVIAFFVNAHGAELEKSMVGMFRSLLFQILESYPELQEILDQLCLDTRPQTMEMNWELETLQEMFSAVIHNLGERHLVCLIDGLDGVDEEQARHFLDFVNDVAEKSVANGTKFNVCFSTRHYPYLTRQHGLELILEDEPRQRTDMERYVRSRIKIGQGKVFDEVVAQVLERSAGIFLWTVLMVDILSREIQRGRIYALQKNLQNHPLT